ncbi:MAG: 50S ribosomal protein L4, partial [Nitrospirae bacterium]
MVDVPVVNMNNEERGSFSLPEGLFGGEVRIDIVHEVVKNYLANQRHGNASTKSRGEVRGGGRKPWRQKGTGRARAGSIRSPIWVGGGVVFGPKKRDYSYKINKKLKDIALKSALTAKYK